MAHFAQLDENNLVLQVIVVSNDVIQNLPFPESEPIGVAFCKSLLGADTIWKQTSYNNNFRKRYANIGYTYLQQPDVFIAPKPEQYPSWILNNDYEWAPPIPRPTDTVYVWDESTVSWVPSPKPYPSWIAKGDPLAWYAPKPYPTDGRMYKWDEPTESWVPLLTLMSEEYAP